MNNTNLKPFSKSELDYLESMIMESIDDHVIFGNPSFVDTLIAETHYEATFFIENPIFSTDEESGLSDAFLSIYFYKTSLRDGAIGRVKFSGYIQNNTENSVGDIRDGEDFMDDFSIPDIQYQESFHIADDSLESFLGDSSQLKQMYEKFLPRFKKVVTSINDSQIIEG